MWFNLHIFIGLCIWTNIIHQKKILRVDYVPLFLTWEICLLLWVNNRGRASILGHLLTSGRICSPGCNWQSPRSSREHWILLSPSVPSNWLFSGRREGALISFKKDTCSLTTLRGSENLTANIIFGLCSLDPILGWKEEWNGAWCWGGGRWGDAVEKVAVAPVPFWVPCGPVRFTGWEDALSVSSASVSASATYSVFWWLPERTTEWPGSGKVRLSESGRSIVSGWGPPRNRCLELAFNSLCEKRKEKEGL